MSSDSSSFNFKEIDHEGFETLKVISDAVNFNNWTFDVISPFCSGKILEVGSGIGNISSRFIEKGFDLTLSDLRENYRAFLASKFPNLSTDGNILQLDLVHKEFENVYNNFLNSFDTVFALNVVEHIEDDKQAIANCKKLLKPGGTLIILMPAFQSLYNNFDRQLCHYKRYNKSSVEKLFLVNDITLKETFYFNAGGIPGWYFSGNILKNRIIPESQMKLFDMQVPFFRWIDILLRRKIGLSVICVGTK